MYFVIPVVLVLIPCCESFKKTEAPITGELFSSKI